MGKNTSIYTLLLLLLYTIKSFGYKAVVISPIADAINTPIKDKEYMNLTICGGLKNPFIACKRGHQILLNEIVDVIEEKDNQAHIYIPTIFYIGNDTKKKHNQYWVQKKHLMPIADLIDKQKLPDPFNKNYIKKCNTNTITLTLPFYCKKTDRTFSAGTRFKRVRPHVAEKKITVWALNTKNNTFYKMHIPHTQCIIPTNDKNKQVDNFVQLLKQWAHQKNGYIPYVWGGSSFCNVTQSESFDEVETTKKNKTCSHYVIKKYTAYPMSGFDCSSLIARAAQICNIPYFFKNTTTLAHFLPTIDEKTSIENGDLIWIPWHVMIISDVKNNKLIEARSYNHGFGKVHELPINNVFKDINTVEMLKKHMLEKKPIKRINKNGEIKDIFKIFKILKFKHVFTQPTYP